MIAGAGAWLACGSFTSDPEAAPASVAPEGGEAAAVEGGCKPFAPFTKVAIVDLPTDGGVFAPALTSDEGAIVYTDRGGGRSILRIAERDAQSGHFGPPRALALPDGGAIEGASPWLSDDRRTLMYAGLGDGHRQLVRATRADTTGPFSMYEVLVAGPSLSANDPRPVPGDVGIGVAYRADVFDGGTLTLRELRVVRGAVTAAPLLATPTPTYGYAHPVFVGPCVLYAARVSGVNGADFEIVRGTETSPGRYGSSFAIPIQP